MHTYSVFCFIGLLFGEHRHSQLDWKNTGIDAGNHACKYEYTDRNYLAKAVYNTNISGVFSEIIQMAYLVRRNGEYGHLEYDANGNILNLIRKGPPGAGGTSFSDMDALTYSYNRSSVLLNRLNSVSDGIGDAGSIRKVVGFIFLPARTSLTLSRTYVGKRTSTSTCSVGFPRLGNLRGRVGKTSHTQLSGMFRDAGYGDMPATSGYAYNAIGQLTGNSLSQTFNYNVYGKVENISNPVGLVANYDYDDRAFRVKKITYDDSGLGQETTWYIRDLSGNILGAYQTITGNTSLLEMPIYASGRIGQANTSAGVITNYLYEISDHLGNVRATFKNNNGVADIVTARDYYPFGMDMPQRIVGTGYRFGYQGQFAEKDEETGNNQFEARLYDNRIGRRLTTDPAGQFWSPYVSMDNNPIALIDPWGAEGEPGNGGVKAGDTFTGDDGKTYTASCDGAVVSASKPSNTMAHAFGQMAVNDNTTFVNQIHTDITRQAKEENKLISFLMRLEENLKGPGEYIEGGVIYYVTDGSGTWDSGTNSRKGAEAVDVTDLLTALSAGMGTKSIKGSPTVTDKAYDDIQARINKSNQINKMIRELMESGVNLTDAVMTVNSALKNSRLMAKNSQQVEAAVEATSQGILDMAKFKVDVIDQDLDSIYYYRDGRLVLKTDTMPTFLKASEANYNKIKVVDYE